VSRDQGGREDEINKREGAMVRKMNEWYKRKRNGPGENQVFKYYFDLK
jgi:hypothetical protein